jgi:hypothetical protein
VSIEFEARVISRVDEHKRTQCFFKADSLRITPLHSPLTYPQFVQRTGIRKQQRLLERIFNFTIPRWTEVSPSRGHQNEEPAPVPVRFVCFFVDM